MGLFDIFKSGPNKKAILAQVQKAKEVYAQSEYRRMAMEKLLKWGSDEALAGVLERFLVVVQSPHWDEDEKRWLVEEMIKLGDLALPVLKNFILTKNEVNHALIAYRKIVEDDEKYRDLLAEALRTRPPSDHRSVQAKQELIAAIGEFDAGLFDDLLLPYLDDHSDDVQCIATEVLAKSANEGVQKKLVNLLKSEIHSARVLRTAADAVARLNIFLGENSKLSDVVLEDFKIDGGRLVRLHQ